jgi:hypothetical protein
MTRSRQAATTKVQQAIELLDADYQQARRDDIVIAMFKAREKSDSMTLEGVRDILSSLGMRFESIQSLLSYHENATRRFQDRPLS